MATWNDYKNHVRESNPEIGRDFDEVEERAKIVSAGGLKIRRLLRHSEGCRG